MQIGLIGGIGPAATDYYYQNIIRTFHDKGADLQLTMAHTEISCLAGPRIRSASETSTRTNKEYF